VGGEWEDDSACDEEGKKNAPARGAAEGKRGSSGRLMGRVGERKRKKSDEKGVRKTPYKGALLEKMTSPAHKGAEKAGGRKIRGKRSEGGRSLGGTAGAIQGGRGRWCLARTCLTIRGSNGKGGGRDPDSRRTVCVVEKVIGSCA